MRTTTVRISREYFFGACLECQCWFKDSRRILICSANDRGICDEAQGYRGSLRPSRAKNFETNRFSLNNITCRLSTPELVTCVELIPRRVHKCLSSADKKNNLRVGGQVLHETQRSSPRGRFAKLFNGTTWWGHKTSTALPRSSYATLYRSIWLDAITETISTLRVSPFKRDQTSILPRRIFQR